MKRLFYLLFLLCIYKADATELLFKPLTANPFEPRIGTVYEEEDDRLRLDIGASFDMVRFGTEDTLSKFKSALGADFFTYTRLRSEGRFKFPVETSDYFFGLNYSCRFELESIALEGRARLSHISSHLVDGYSDNSVFFQEPFVYSREFLDIVLAMDYSGLRPYIGATFVFSYQPEDINKVIPQIGFDWQKPISNIFDFIIGYDLKLDGQNGVASAIHSSQAGVITKISNHFGIFTGIYSYHGNSMHGMFYNTKDSYFGYGFQLIYY
jgi:hypothetical protein